MNTRVRHVLASVLDLPPTAVPETGTQQTLPGWDSLAHVQLVMSLEAEFGVSFGIDQALKLTSVRAIHAALAEWGVEMSADGDHS